MGWLDGWWKSEDPVDTLDPSLKKFLEKQAPARYQSTSDKSASEPAPTYRSQLGLSDSTGVAAQVAAQEAAKNDGSRLAEQTPLPKESLFQDGRYKDLWKNYRPQSDIDAAGKSDQEKLMDIVDSFKDRQAEVGRAALENCSEEQWLVTDCFRSGGWKSRMTMCREENRQLSRCVEMQSRFMKALGYLTMAPRSNEETEKLQMHADRLYHRMLGHEKMVAEAKEQGLPAPSLPPIVDSLPMSKDLPHYTAKPITYDDLPPNLQESLAKSRLTGLEGLELELARRELDHYIAHNQDMLARIQSRWHEEYHERKERYAEGTERFGDVIKRYFDFRKYSEEPPTSKSETPSTTSSSSSSSTP